MVQTLNLAILAEDGRAVKGGSPPGAFCAGCGSPLIYIKGVCKCRICSPPDASPDNLKSRFRARRFFVKCRDGMLVAHARGMHVRTFVLTESDYALGMGLSFGSAVKKFKEKFRYDYGADTGLVWVEHLQGAKERLNWHVVAWGAEKLNLDDLNDFWHKVYGSLVTWRKKRDGGMLVLDAASEAKYLAKYVGGEGFVRARFSYNWVFPGWFDYCKWANSTFGEFPSIQELASLASEDAAGRLGNCRFRDWYITQQDSLKAIWADKIMGPSPDEARWLAEYRRRRGRA